jgi:hypothetical protein
VILATTADEISSADKEELEGLHYDGSERGRGEGQHYDYVNNEQRGGGRVAVVQEMIMCDERYQFKFE